MIDLMITGHNKIWVIIYPINVIIELVGHNIINITIINIMMVL
jgi:hypothetical protein